MDREGVIIGAGVVIVLTGTIGAIQAGKNPWPAVGSGIGMTALLSILAAAGEGPAKVAAGLAIVAAMGAVFFHALPLFDLFSGLGGEKQ